MISHLGSELRTYRVAYLLGLLLYPGFIALDRLVYPEYCEQFLRIRLSVTVFLLLAFFLNGRIGRAWAVPLAALSVLVVGVSNSLFCYLSGEGFASPYYAGLLILILVSSSFMQMDRPTFLLMMVILVGQHFVILNLVSWKFADLAINVALVGAFVVASLGLQSHFRNVLREITQLRGILPICAACKQIRDDEGYWHQLEKYFHVHTDVDFSHSYCPSCFDASLQMAKEAHEGQKNTPSPDQS